MVGWMGIGVEGREGAVLAVRHLVDTAEWWAGDADCMLALDLSEDI